MLRSCGVRTSTRTTSTDEEGRLLRRILVPLAKLRATREAVTAASQALEVFGGNGYMEDWPMARQLRDAQCHTMWEGTENICSLDVRRAMVNEGAHTALIARVGGLNVGFKDLRIDAAWRGRARWNEARMMGWFLDIRTDEPADEIVALCERAVRGLAFGGEVFDVSVSKPGGEKGIGGKIR